MATATPAPAPVEPQLPEAPSRGGTVIHAVLLVVGVAAAVVGAGYGITVPDTGGEVGAGALPVLAGSGLALFAAVEVVKDLVAVRRHRTRGTAASGAPTRPGLPLAAADLLPGTTTDVAAASTGPSGPAEEERDIFGRTAAQRKRMLLVVCGLLLLAVLAIPLIGFLISFGLLLLVLSWRVEGRRLLPSAVTTVIVVVVTRLVFVNFLGVPLPSGLLGVL